MPILGIRSVRMMLPPIGVLMFRRTWRRTPHISGLAKPFEPSRLRQLAARIAEFQEARLNCSRSRPEDEDHKMILLLEYLCRCGVSQVRAATSNA
jgi:hypothetical protein